MQLVDQRNVVNASKDGWYYSADRVPQNDGAEHV